MLSFYQSNVTQYLNLKVDARLRLHQTRVAGLRTDRHRRLVEEELALVVHQPRGISPRRDLKVAPRPVVHIVERRIAPEALEPRPSFSLRGNPEQRRLRVRDASVHGFVDVPRLRLIRTDGRRRPLVGPLHRLAPERYARISSTTSTTSRLFSAFKVIRAPFLRMGPVHGPELQPF